MSDSKIERLRSCIDRNQFAANLGYKPKSLAYILFQIRDEDKYTYFEIDKKNGDKRLIAAPVDKLKLLQKRLAQYLQDCVFEIENNQNINRDHVLAHGFYRGRSIRTNASVHTGRKWVFNTDLEDFFPSINFGRVRGYFIKNRNFQLHPNVATTIAQICCHKNQLPQGSPCSPIISNLIGQILDIRLNKIAKRERCSYTHYADDITFSTSKREFPTEIAAKKIDCDGNETWAPSEEVRFMISSQGFKVNHNKNRMQFYWSRQDVTGLTVNEKANIDRKYLRTVRAQCDALVKKGEPFRTEEHFGEKFMIPYDPTKLKGKLSHIFNIKGHEYEYRRLSNQLHDVPSFYKTHRLFLDHQSFASNMQPTILFEGKTDRIYIHYALKKLHEKYPELISKSDSGSFNFKIDLFNYSRTTDAIQMLAGGTGDLTKLIRTYEARLKAIPAATLEQPVIIVVDNDQGSKEVFNVINSITKPKKKIDGSERFCHIMRNLYLTATPIPKGKSESCIETFLPVDVLRTNLEGKTFHAPEKGFDPHFHYGKAALAEKVVSKNWKNISFYKFQGILNNIRSIIQHHKDNLE